MAGSPRKGDPTAALGGDADGEVSHNHARRGKSSRRRAMATSRAACGYQGKLDRFAACAMTGLARSGSGGVGMHRLGRGGVKAQ